MSKCRITVLKCLFDQELKDKYIYDDNYGLCPYFRPGNVIEYEGGDRPEGFGCRIGWKSISDEAERFTAASPKDMPKMAGPGDDVHIVCCNDGVRPVIFKLERED